MNEGMATHKHDGEGDNNLSKNRQSWDESHSQVTQQLLNLDTKYFIKQSLSTPCLSVIKKAEGIWIEDTNNRRYMDFHGNNVHHIGYSHPRLIADVKKQISDLSFSPRRFTCDPAIQLAQKLAEITPGELSKTLLATGGSDAIDMSLKLARIVTGRHKTISFWDSFHGAGFGGISIGGESLFRGEPIGPLLTGAEHVAPFNCYRCPYGHKDQGNQKNYELCGLACAKMIQYILEKEGDIAAVIAEPIRAIPYLPPPGFWESVRKACNQNGALLIFDEIPCGLGKTGKMFSCEHQNVVPDMLVCGKSLGGGILPISALIVHPDLDVATSKSIGHYTHEKNPITARAALSTIEIIQDDGLLENATTVGNYALERLIDIQNRVPLVDNVRGQGFLLGLDLVKDRKTREPAYDVADRVLYRCFENGLSFKTSMGNVLTLTPPLITSRKQIDKAMTILEDAIREDL